VNVEALLRVTQERRQLTGDGGRLDAVRESGGGHFQYHYDPRGDLIEIVEADGQRRTYEYDAARRLVCTRHPDGGTTRYAYADDRLVEVDDRDLISRFAYDGAGRLARVQRGTTSTSVYRYDDRGRVVLARTSRVTDRWQYHDGGPGRGRIAALTQEIDGLVLDVRLEYDAQGRLATMRLPGSDLPVRYTWDQRGRPLTVGLGDEEIGRFSYDDTARTVWVGLANGLRGETIANQADGRPAAQTVYQGDEPLWQRRLIYDELGQIETDGEHAYSYDQLGRLIGAEDRSTGTHYSYAYDGLDRRTRDAGPAGERVYRYDPLGRLAEREADGHAPQLTYDPWGRLAVRRTVDQIWTYRYDGVGLLQQVRCNGELCADLTYDHKGRLVLVERGGDVERYVYGPADELLAITDATGRPWRLFVHTPLGVLAESHGPLGQGALFFRHDDDKGSTRLVTDRAGRVVVRYDWGPYGESVVTQYASDAGWDTVRPAFGGRLWYPEIGLFYFGARWYDPDLGQFLTPDSYTGAPDDLRLVNPLRPTSQQATARAEILGEWLKQPRVRNPYAFCANDPIGHVDPNGHWSFGGVLLSLLGAIWTLPNTLFGLLVEITCLMGEVVRWLVWLVTAGHVSWETPGFDVAASGRINAFALVFSGGWLGSFSSLLGITFGNVFFVYKDWRASPYITGQPDPVAPPAYGGTTIPRDQALYEHELRHTNQYGWFGPFFHLGLPLFGVYEWDVIFNGYRDAWLERDAREHGV
jgi:RHS repeat-associated protein